MNTFSDEYFMNIALQQAEEALEHNEIPVGAVIVLENQIIGKGYNLTQTLNDVTAHAEMQAITAAAQSLGAKYLTNCTLYVTLEPCVMCAGAMFWSQISRLVYGAEDPKRGFSKVDSNLLHPKTTVKKGVLEAECAQLITQFFKERRKL